MLAGQTEATLQCWGGYYCPIGLSEPNPVLYLCPQGLHCPNGSEIYKVSVLWGGYYCPSGLSAGLGKSKAKGVNPDRKSGGARATHGLHTLLRPGFSVPTAVRSVRCYNNNNFISSITMMCCVVLYRSVQTVTTPARRAKPAVTCVHKGSTVSPSTPATPR